ncbi:MAG TPA: hypothetical protein VLK33_05750, partial [Terriglobales bacterium]|nr:hypothetical protein [Terriglobales bacterium]
TGLGTTVNQTTNALGSVLGTTLGDGSLANAASKVSLNTIVANVDALPKNKLVKLCVSAGGGSGCSTNDRKTLINVLNGKIALLPKLKLLNLCVSVGSGCGVATIVPTPGPNPRPVPHPPGPNNNNDVASLSDADIKKLCIKIMGAGGPVDSTLRHYCARH